jgi:hypothetical protein
VEKAAGYEEACEADKAAESKSGDARPFAKEENQEARDYFSRQEKTSRL